MTSTGEPTPRSTAEILAQALERLERVSGAEDGRRVVAAMSGGLDSSVTAALLHRAGYEVVGISMHLFDKGAGLRTSEGKCCTLNDFQDAKRVADLVGFPHYVLDFETRFQEKVIQPFVASYARGETPSPCILCNQFLKFKSLIEAANELGARFVATGHYAKILFRDGIYHLLKADDPLKDQSYFLFSHTQETLARTLFPLEGLAKAQVRELARFLGLPVAEKPESQEICFVTQGRYDKYLEEKGCAPREGQGPFRHVDGTLLGQHDGYWRFTVGQRRGLGIAYARPLYVTGIDPATRTVWVGEAEHLYGSDLEAREATWCGMPPAAPFPCRAKLRSRSSEAPAFVEPLGNGRVRVRFESPQRAITPGQAIVFYEGDEVLGGAWIERGR